MKTKRYELNKNKYLNDDEQKVLQLTLTNYRDTDFRDTTLIWLALNCGGRAQEILNLRAEDLDHSEKTAFIRGLKDSDDRAIPLPPWLFKRVAHIANGGAAQDPIFDISYSRFRQIWEHYRPVKTKTLHCLRHTFAINVYRRSKDLLALRVALGHRSINNTMIYSNYVFKTSELKRAILG